MTGIFHSFFFKVSEICSFCSFTRFQTNPNPTLSYFSTLCFFIFPSLITSCLASAFSFITPFPSPPSTILPPQPLSINGLYPKKDLPPCSIRRNIRYPASSTHSNHLCTSFIHDKVHARL